AATQLNAELTIDEVVDKHWDNGNSPAATNPPPTPPSNNFKFKSVYLDGSVQDNTDIHLMAAADTLTVDTNGNGQIRLFVTAKGLDDVVLSFTGAKLAASSLPDPKIATPVETAPQPAASLKVVLATGSSASSSPTVVDVNLQGLVATRTATITAVGRKKVTAVGDPTPVVGAVSVITLPVIAPN